MSVLFLGVHDARDLRGRERSVVDAELIQRTSIELARRDVGADVHRRGPRRDAQRQASRSDQGAVYVELDLRAVERNREMRPLVVWQRGAHGYERQAARFADVQIRLIAAYEL